MAERSDTVITEYTINWIVNVQYFKYKTKKRVLLLQRNS